MISTSSVLALLLVIAVYLSSVGLAFNAETALGYGVLFVILAVVFIAASYAYMSVKSESMKKAIRACPQCGSYDISHLKGYPRYMWWFDFLPTKYVCQNCGYEGLPLELDSIKDYKKFLQKKRKQQQKS